VHASPIAVASSGQLTQSERTQCTCVGQCQRCRRGGDWLLAAAASNERCGLNLSRSGKWRVALHVPVTFMITPRGTAFAHDGRGPVACSNCD
jgi:hypothetical protein